MGFKSRQPRRTNATPSRHALAALARVTRRDKRLGRPDTGICPGRKWSTPSSGEQTANNQKTPSCGLISSRLWVLCQDAEVYQQRLPCDSTAEIHTRHTNQHGPKPAMLSKCQTLPKTHLARPALRPILSNPSAHRAGSVNACLTKGTPPNHPDKPFGVYDARDRHSFLPLTHAQILTHCATC